MALSEQRGLQLHTVSATTSAGGAATVYTDVPVWGEVVSIAYVKSTFDNGVDFTITGETSGVSLWTDTDVNASEIVYPRVLENGNTDGAALTTRQGVVLAGERVKIVIAQGGNAKAGSFRIIVRT
jgi:hypothetical protein